MGDAPGAYLGKLFLVLNLKQKTHKTIENLKANRGYLHNILPMGKVKTYAEATEMLTKLPMAQLRCVLNYSYSFVECEGILKVQYQKVSITVGMEGFQLVKLSDLLK